MPEACPKCGKPLFMQASKRGLFIGCSGYPECDYTRPFGDRRRPGDNILGNDPASGLPVKLLNGRFGWYVQIGDMPEDKKAPKPRRASWPKDIPHENATLELALKLLSLPREVGHHPETGAAHRRQQRPLRPVPAARRQVQVDPQDRQRVRNRPAARARSAGDGARAARRRLAASVLKNLGPHPDDGKDITVRSGRYGPYVKHGSTNATLPKDITPEEITLDEALGLIAARVAKGPAKKPARKAAAKPAAKKRKPPTPTRRRSPPRKRQPPKRRPPKPATAKKPASKKAAA
jgi:DNA topoisomerase I